MDKDALLLAQSIQRETLYSYLNGNVELWKALGMASELVNALGKRTEAQEADFREQLERD